MKFQIYWTVYNPKLRREVELHNTELWEAADEGTAQRKLNEVEPPELGWGLRVINRRLVKISD